MSRARSILIALAAFSLLATFQRSEAVTFNLDGAICVLNVTITFTGGGVKMKSVEVEGLPVMLTSPSFTISVAQAVDLDGSQSGTQACLYNFGGITPARSTAVTATGTETSDDFWTCETSLATGTWVQSWSGPPDSSSPTTTWFGRFAITGVWGAWTLVVHDPAMEYVGVIPLVFADPGDALERTACSDASNGIASLALTGVELFQDPRVTI